VALRVANPYRHTLLCRIPRRGEDVAPMLDIADVETGGLL
jgi:hypothetical protein